MALAQDPVLCGVKLIAEPWDLGPGGYQSGGFPRGWMEWNDRFRDSMRRFWLGWQHQSRQRHRLRPARRLRAAPVRLQRPVPGASGARRRHRSTTWCRTTASRLRDLVSYNNRHNEANGEDNRDGHAETLSFNCGFEGRDRRRRHPGAARQAAARAAGLHAAQPGHADAGGRRRAGPDPGRQQQPVQPGQRHHLARLAGRRRRPDRIHGPAAANCAARRCRSGPTGTAATTTRWACATCAGCGPTARPWSRATGTTAPAARWPA